MLFSSILGSTESVPYQQSASCQYLKPQENRFKRPTWLLEAEDPACVPGAAPGTPACPVQPVSPSGWPSRVMQPHHSISSSHFCARPCTWRDGNNASSFLFSPVEVAAGPSWTPAYVQAVEEVFSCTADYFTETSIVNLNSTNSISF